MAAWDGHLRQSEWALNWISPELAPAEREKVVGVVGGWQWSECSW